MKKFLLSALMLTTLNTASAQRFMRIWQGGESTRIALQDITYTDSGARISADGVVYGTTKLINSSAIELSRNAYLTQRLGEILSKGWVIALIVVLLVFMLIYLILVMRYRRLRRRHLRERRRAEKLRREQEQARAKQRVSYDLARPDDRFDFAADMSEFFDDEKK